MILLESTPKIFSRSARAYFSGTVSEVSWRSTKFHEVFTYKTYNETSWNFVKQFHQNSAVSKFGTLYFIWLNIVLICVHSQNFFSILNSFSFFLLLHFIKEVVSSNIKSLSDQLVRRCASTRKIVTFNSNCIRQHSAHKRNHSRIFVQNFFANPTNGEGCENLERWPIIPIQEQVYGRCDFTLGTKI